MSDLRVYVHMGTGVYGRNIYSCLCDVHVIFYRREYPPSQNSEPNASTCTAHAFTHPHIKCPKPIMQPLPHHIFMYVPIYANTSTISRSRTHLTHTRYCKNCMLATGKQCTPDAADLSSNLPVSTTLQAQVSEHRLFRLGQILTTSAVKK